MALRVRGETVDEITGAARAMRAKALAIEAPPGAIDTCGTGGDASGSFNISTATALVVAGAGVPVAKHGNRNLSSKSGSADVLAALGVNIDADMELVRRAIWEAVRFNPHTPFLIRHCSRETRLATGTPRGQRIPAGSMVFLAIDSAQFDATAFPDPGQFRVDRRRYGRAHHHRHQHGGRAQ